MCVRACACASAHVGCQRVPLSIASNMYYAHILLHLKASYVPYAFTLKGLYVHLCCK